MSVGQFKDWLRKLAEKLMGQQPVAALDGGTVFLVDRQGTCIKPERRIVLQAKETI